MTDQPGYSQEDMNQMAENQAIQEAATGQPIQNQQQRQDQRYDKLSPESDKFKIKKALRGLKQKQRKVQKGGQTYTQAVWVPDEQRALVNETGFRKIWSLIEGLMNNNITYANQNPNDEMHSGFNTMADLIKSIIKHHEDWGIDDQHDAGYIVDIVHSNIKASLSKARNARGMRNDETIREERTVRKAENETSDSNSSMMSVFN